MILKAFIIFIVISFGEIINGNIRIRILVKKFGKVKAQFLSFLLGLTIIYTTCFLFLPWIGPNSFADCFLIGLFWMTLMFMVDLYFAIKVFHKSWKAVIEDLNLLKGNYLGLGMILLFFCPSIIFYLKF